MVFAGLGQAFQELGGTIQSQHSSTHFLVGFQRLDVQNSELTTQRVLVAESNNGG